VLAVATDNPRLSRSCSRNHKRQEAFSLRRECHMSAPELSASAQASAAHTEACQPRATCSILGKSATAADAAACRSALQLPDKKSPEGLAASTSALGAVPDSSGWLPDRLSGKGGCLTSMANWLPWARGLLVSSSAGTQSVDDLSVAAGA